MALSYPYESEFRRLIAVEKLDQFEQLMHTQTFEEVPLFSRYSHIAFLDGEAPAEQNRILIRAAASHLASILDFSRTYFADSRDYFCMLSVTNWDLVSDGDAVIPNFWYTNPSHGVLEHVKLHPATSTRAGLVAASFDHSSAYEIYESSPAAAVERVYVQLSSSV